MFEPPFSFLHIPNCHIPNPFWKDVIKHYLNFSNKHSLSNPINYLEHPIHYNPRIKRDNKSIYLKEWVENDIIKIRDLMMEGEEAIMSFDSFKQKYANTNSTNFLMYQGIVNSIRALKRSIDIQNNETATLNSNDSWSIILSGNKDVKAVFLVVKDLPTAVLKWNLSFTNLNWTLIFSKCFKISKDTKLQWFQARTLHRILPTNRYLNICKIAETHDCTFI